MSGGEDAYLGNYAIVKINEYRFTISISLSHTSRPAPGHLGVHSPPPSSGATPPSPSLDARFRGWPYSVSAGSGENNNNYDGRSACGPFWR